MKTKPVIWSFGGGVQSVAIAVYVARGLLPKPDRVVMADTGRESSLTWNYTQSYSIPLLESVCLNLEIIPPSYSKVGLYSRNGLLLIPAYTEKGKGHTYCSTEWKRRPQERYFREQGFGPENPIVSWFGMSLDEYYRMRKSDLKWIEYRYPLCEIYKRRRFECEQDIADFGLPVPPKSACWMCPNRNDAEWMQQKEQAPSDHEKAIALENQLHARNDGAKVYLCKDLKPISEVNFSAFYRRQREHYR